MRLKKAKYIFLLSCLALCGEFVSSRDTLPSERTKETAALWGGDSLGTRRERRADLRRTEDGRADSSAAEPLPAARGIDSVALSTP
ncbi:hypothetical protein, partial [uncultured Alistipes sp.]|uniref:hypothetical protein n=1 Tax=uncultured Alistipes sp. TaxID=538949 RepID=UPI00260B1B93